MLKSFFKFCSSRLETAASLAPKDEEEKVKTKDTVAKSHEKNGHTKRRGRKRHSHRRARRSVSSKADPHTSNPFQCLSKHFSMYLLL